MPSLNPSHLQRFKDKVVIVTGAASGIGEATARRFSDEGARVLLADRDTAALTKVFESLPAERTAARETDVSHHDDVRQMVAFAIERFGRLDVLVSDAGIFADGSVTEVSPEDWHQVQATNVNGVFYGAREAMPHLEKTGGCIVNVASVSGLGADWNLAAYNTSKGAVVNLTRAMALDAGRKGVRVNAVCPSLTHTAMTADMADDQELLAKFAERIALGRGAQPVEIAAVIAFLASPDAGFVNGVNLPVDGGLTASNGQPPQ
ncbi:3-oxoacyl-ACP reductase [Herbaspirillum rubrisubalbicans]|jgi:meso-butanediol dehydrogenase/(S,S)-butanediol dehydrogenase/diacetyl reductase|uniref:3-oxoacyl-ACP reductase n=2 Tax=Herbaspirillum rubrisubalbicans TaxID=80842 RepID=A0ABX9BYB3_9BURK|nr:SDR family oxidoreductase [Herbaspirillum rubrisubalbicans]MCP1572346.1 meso-butanediol dehydrogenase/(S,S)-butanediol dehydrogenase/diacetyl reductase [Herbaspirillum rubrisubalbicans]NQE50692.1 3-oxoacyl-ACP reductase [Herbaspirillum rubrisubalbicans]QJQ00977.1 NAD(P)-dependent oxidoreductase [Herbaspirillum rubrisubalbicans Os34]RAM62752.1 3-oxoacyl-ACP reductase [Herbaspirillum rubrisubalbicans]RAN49358.1 3-oxoacyl-ACP reductase [Herbaspirillum rubrisubalbicans]